MSVWSKLFGSGEAPDLTRLTPPSRGLPTIVAVVPDALTVTFHAHDVAEGSQGNFLTAVSDGLVKRRQRELVVTLRLELLPLPDLELALPPQRGKCSRSRERVEQNFQNAGAGRPLRDRRQARASARAQAFAGDPGPRGRRA